MYLKTDKITVTLGDVVLTSHLNFQLEQQFNLDPTGISGWLDGTSTRRLTTARPNGNGDFVERSYMDSRIISLSGVAMAKTPAAIRNLRDIFMGIFSNGGYREISVQLGSEVRYATAGLEGKPSWIVLNDNNAAWKIDLYAPDPFIYGAEKIVQTEANVTSGAMAYPLTYVLDYSLIKPEAAQSISNRGNAEAWPKFRVVGNYYSGFTISNNLNKKVTYNGLVTTQSAVTIDMATGTAMQNGVDKTTLVSDRGWFSIAPQETIRPSFIPIQNGSGWCDIIYRDTWI